MPTDKLNKEIFFDLSVELFVIINPLGIIEQINEIVTQTLGYAQDEMVGKSFHPFIFHEDLQITEHEFAQLSRTGVPTIGFQIRLKKKDGSAIWISWNGVSRNEYIYIAGRNVTIEKQKKEYSTKIQNLLLAFVKQAPIAIAMCDKNLNIIQTSNLFLDDLNIKEKYIRGKSFFEIIPAASFDFSTLYNTISDSNSHHIIEFHTEIFHRDCWFDLKITPWGQKEDYPEGLMLHLTNKTREKSAEAEIRIQNQMLKGILENLPVIIFKVDSTGTFTQSIGAGLKSIGLKNNEIIGQSIFQLYPNYADFSKECLAGGNFSLLVEIVHNNRTICLQTHFFYDEISQGAIGFCLDITEKVEMLKALESARLIAEKANALKSRFLANMSHEIRTPLNSIIGFSEILASENLTDRQNEYIKYILSSGKTLFTLIGDILDLSKIEEGKEQVIEKPFQIKLLLAESLLPYKFKANDKGLSFEFIIDDSIPTSLVGDYDKLHRVLINLVTNAIKFTEKGQVSIFINREETFSNGILLNFQVIDTGIGVPFKKQKDIFESFTQGDISVGKVYGGSGLGLTIARDLVTLLGGHLEVISPYKSESGSCFQFQLKLKINSENPTTENLKIEKKFENSPSILVAEDNIMNQKLAEIILTNLGCRPMFVDNGQEAVTKVSEEVFDLVLMDIQMPVMDGLQATKAIRLFNKSIPVIALTAHVNKEEYDQYMKEGMNACLPKPYSEQQLFEVINKWMG